MSKSMTTARLILILNLLCLTPLLGQGQEVCGTMEQDRISRARFPERGTLEQFERFIEHEIRLREQLLASGRRMQGVIKIPVIVHVVHNGEPVGTGPNISEAQVNAQLEVLNEDFRRMAGTPGYNDHPSGADIEIEFCLSKVDENGNTMAEPGIDRVNGNRSEWSRNDIEANLKPNTYWDPNKFYNIWTVKFAAAEASLLGYAQFPDQSGLPGLQEEGGPASTDGVVVRYQSFGSVTKGNFPVMQAPYNRGRTLSHETGHWLGLRHIWGDGNCADDFVADTPPQAGPSSGCPLGRQSCNAINMVQNYMDYSEDACLNIFTQGQKNRMLTVMEVSPRRKVLTENNFCGLTVVAAPEADFTIDAENCVLLGSQVTFTDLSKNFPSEWIWTFEGGDPNTSNVKNPKVTYNSAGTFDAQLIVKNSLGSDTLLLPDFVTVSAEGLCREFNNFLPGYTPSTLLISDFTNHTGYLTGHNTAGTRGLSEYFQNDCGYKYVSGTAIRFSNLEITSEDTRITVVVWNARGKQNSPGAVIERKEITTRQVLEDIANGQPTTVIFDRETPVFSRPFHIGVEIDYSDGSKLAITSSANGEATNATSWVKHSSGEWQLFTIAYGANIAMDIEAFVGMHPSVQVSASKLLVYPGEEVVLNGRGASIFIWNSTDGEVQNIAGPQIIVTPTETTTYTTTGSGLDLCHQTATTTIYIREDIVGTEPHKVFSGITVYPNPSSNQLKLNIENSYRGNIAVSIESVFGKKLGDAITGQKTGNSFTQIIDTQHLNAGIYLIRVKLDGKTKTIKWTKL